MESAIFVVGLEDRVKNKDNRKRTQIAVLVIIEQINRSKW